MEWARMTAHAAAMVMRPMPGIGEYKTVLKVFRGGIGFPRPTSTHTVMKHRASDCFLNKRIFLKQVLFAFPVGVSWRNH